jgi:hypothetical protein
MSSSSIRGALQRLLLLVVLHLACTARGRQVQTRPTAVLISSAAKLHPPPSRNDSSTASLVARGEPPRLPSLASNPPAFLLA